MSKELSYEEISPYVFVTKLAGFEHSKYIQPFATKKPINKNDIPMVQGKNIRNGVFIEKYDWFIKKEISDNLPRSVLNKKCILIPYVGSNLGEVGIFHNKYVCHLASNIAKVELNSDRYLLEYIMYYMQSKIGQSYLFQAKQGSSQPNITMESIRKTKIIKRTINEQKKIVKILSSIDNQIKRNNEMVQKLQVLSQTIFDKFYRYKMLKFNGTLNDICSLPSGYSFKPNSYISNGKYNLVTIKNVNGIFVDYQKINKINVIPNNLKSYCKLNVGDILVSLTGNVGRISINTSSNSLLNQRVSIILCKNNEYKLYIYLLLNNPYYQLKINQIANGTSQKNLSPLDIEKLKIYIPNDIKKFNNATKDILNQMCKINLQTNKLFDIKNKVLPLLINGQLQ